MRSWYVRAAAAIAAAAVFNVGVAHLASLPSYISKHDFLLMVDLLVLAALGGDALGERRSTGRRAPPKKRRQRGKHHEHDQPVE